MNFNKFVTLTVKKYFGNNFVPVHCHFLKSQIKLFSDILYCLNFTRESERPVELGNPNTCAEAKLCLFLFMAALEIVCCETEIFKTISFG